MKILYLLAFLPLLILTVSSQELSSNPISIVNQQRENNLVLPSPLPTMRAKHYEWNNDFSKDMINTMNAAAKVRRRSSSPTPTRSLDVSDLEISVDFSELDWKYYNRDGVTRVNPKNYGYENRILVQAVRKNSFGEWEVLTTTKLITDDQVFFVGIEDNMTCLSRMDRKQMSCYYLPSDDYDLRIGYDISLGTKLVVSAVLLCVLILF